MHLMQSKAFLECTFDAVNTNLPLFIIKSFITLLYPLSFQHRKELLSMMVISLMPIYFWIINYCDTSLSSMRITTKHKGTPSIVWKSRVAKAVLSGTYLSNLLSLLLVFLSLSKSSQSLGFLIIRHLHPYESWYCWKITFSPFLLLGHI